MLQCGVSFEPSLYFAWPRAKFSPVPMCSPAPADAAADSPAAPPTPPPAKPEKPGRPAKPPPLVTLEKDSSLYYASRVLVDCVVRPSDTRKVSGGLGPVEAAGA